MTCPGWRRSPTRAAERRSAKTPSPWRRASLKILAFLQTLARDSARNRLVPIRLKGVRSRSSSVRSPGSSTFRSSWSSAATREARWTGGGSRRVPPGWPACRCYETGAPCRHGRGHRAWTSSAREARLYPRRLLQHGGSAQADKPPRSVRTFADANARGDYIVVWGWARAERHW